MVGCACLSRIAQSRSASHICCMSAAQVQLMTMWSSVSHWARTFIIRRASSSFFAQSLSVSHVCCVVSRTCQNLVGPRKTDSVCQCVLETNCVIVHAISAPSICCKQGFCCMSVCCMLYAACCMLWVPDCYHFGVFIYLCVSHMLHRIAWCLPPHVSTASAKDVDAASTRTGHRAGKAPVQPHKGHVM